MIDLGILITGGIGLVTTIVSGWTSWFFARKKYDSEVDSNLINNMKESIKLKISKNDLIKLLEKYYEEKLGKKIKISITTTEECFGLYEVEELVTRIKF